MSYAEYLHLAMSGKKELIELYRMTDIYGNCNKSIKTLVRFFLSE